MGEDAATAGTVTSGREPRGEVSRMMSTGHPRGDPPGSSFTSRQAGQS